MDTASEREAIVCLYAAAAGEGSWTRAVEVVGEGFTARTVVLLAHLAGSRDAQVLGATGVDPGDLRAFRECFSVRRVLMTEGIPWPSPGGIRTSETICAPRLLLTSEYTRDVAVRLAAFRLHSQAPFSSEEHQAFAALSPHLRQAIRTAAQLQVASELRGAMQTLGEQFGRGVAVVDASSRVLHANTMFERICAADDGLTTREGVLRTSRVNEPGFSRFLARALGGASGERLDVRRPSGCAPYTLLVSPIPRTMTIVGTSEARVSLVAERSDPDAQAHGGHVIGRVRPDARRVADGRPARRRGHRAATPPSSSASRSTRPALT